MSYSAQPDKWHEEMETVLHGLASCGFDVRGQFVGEDDNAWAYFTDGRNLKEEGLHRVRSIELATLESDAAAFLSLVSIAQADDTTVAEAVRAAAAARQPHQGPS